MDSQVLTTFQECSYKYELNFIQNLRPTWPAPALVKGDVLHTGLEAYYKYLKQELGGEREREHIHTSGVELAIEEANAKAALNGIGDVDLELILHATRDYFNFYKNDDLVPLEIEQPFITELYDDGELRVLYAGKIDLVATASRYEWSPVPFDNKSQSRNQTPSGRSNQFFGYCNAINSSTLVVNRIGLQKTLSAAERFKRYPLSYPQEYRDRWVRNTVIWAKKLEFALDEGLFEENLSSCDKYSGCTYKRICEAHPIEAKEWVIQSDYITGNPWDVTKILGLPEREVVDLREQNGQNI
jgi:hypothetical protein